jgi:hypothetical protein
MNFHKKIYHNITSSYQTLQEQYSIKYLREILLAMLLTVCGFSAYFLHKMYVQYREQKAFVAFSELLDSYAQTMYHVQSNESGNMEQIKTAWQDTAILLDALYKENNNSYLAPYFLALKAQVILQRDGDVDAAIVIMDQALARMSKKSEIATMYYIKRILMGFDSSDEKIREQALQDLMNLAQDSKSPVTQEAQYLLADYLFAHADALKAQQILNQLVQNADNDALLKSPWVILAQEKLGMQSKKNDGN